MKYRELGATGKKISRLGMGCMRLPLSEPGNDGSIDVAHTERMFEQLLSNGVNYFDTAYVYHGGESEKVMGKLLKPFRKLIFLATKSPGWMLKTRDDFRRIFDEQLQRLQTDYIDFYHLHGINREEFNDLNEKTGWLREFQRLKEEGLVHHLCFSFHGPLEDLPWLAETNLFESVLCQYSLLDRAHEQGIARVHELGLGVVVMGPAAGGRIAEFGSNVTRELKVTSAHRARLALQFVWSNANIDCALSGMSSLDQVKDNLQTEREVGELSLQDHEAIIAIMKNLEKLGKQYCTGCKYCMPCPEEVNIPLIFTFKIYNDVYGMIDLAKDRYSQIGKTPWFTGKDAAACIGCGLCEPKCPQKIPIIKQLQECRELFETAE